MINLYNIGALIWIPSDTKRWINDTEQLKIFPSSYSITKMPMLGIFKGYTWSGECEVLCPDGIWAFEQSDIRAYTHKRNQRSKVC